jgi:ribonuclease HII
MLLVGIDEAGRGPIAGPVSVGAFVFLNEKARRIFRGVKESKQLSEKRREEWFAIIRKAKKDGYIDFRVSFQSEKVIDSKGISYAIKKALAKSLNNLKINPNQSYVLLDGGLKAPIDYKNQKTIIRGDEKICIIALASICAKVLRDRQMRKISVKYPQYGFEIHKGYGTKSHYEMIEKHGISPLHRRSFMVKRNYYH